MTGRHRGSGETLVTFFLHHATTGRGRPALRTKRDGEWQTTSWGEWHERSRSLGALMAAAGVGPGDRVAIFVTTREEWVVADVGASLAGGVTVPIYPTLVGDQAAYILEDSGARVLVCEDPSYVRRIVDAGHLPLLERLSKIVLIDGEAAEVPPSLGARTVSFADALRAGGELDRREPTTIEARSASVRPDDLATIVYTSGTTGPPKGVMLTHASFVFETAAVAGSIEVGLTDEHVLFLPLAHIFAKTLLALQLRVGFVTTFAESIPKLMDNLAEVNPTFLGSVPRIYEKVHAVANDKARQLTPERKRLFDWAVDVGQRVARRREQGRAIGPLLTAQHVLADRLVLSKVRARFGTKLRFAITGGAPLAEEITRWFHGAGIPLMEGYGLTETTAATHINVAGSFRFGTVGRPLPGVEIKLAPDGEVLMRGPNIMRGYWRKEADTREAIDPDGWFRSGDIGVIDKDGFLRITDRKKDIIVTAGGKNVAPQNIESMLKQTPWISQAMVYGDRRPYLVALLTLQAEALGAYANDSGRDLASLDVTRDEGVRARVDGVLQAVNGRLSSFETIKRFAILPGDFSVDGGELTPTLKVKRKVVTERHRELLDSLYT